MKTKSTKNVDVFQNAVLDETIVTNSKKPLFPEKVKKMNELLAKYPPEGK